MLTDLQFGRSQTLRPNQLLLQYIAALISLLTGGPPDDIDDPCTGPNIIDKVHLVGLLTTTAHTRSEHLKPIYVFQ